MTTSIHNQVDIAATPTEVWGVLADLDLDEYDPVVTKSAIVGDEHEGLGATRRCDARQGRYFIEKVTDWQAPDRLQFTIIECNLPTRNLTHSYTLEATPTGTRVRQEMRYDTKFGLLGRVLDWLMIRRASDKGIKGFLVGLNATVLKDLSGT